MADGATQARDVRKAPAPADSLRPIDAGRFGNDEARHLLGRIAFGGSPAEIENLARLGPERAVDRLLTFDAAPADAGADRFPPLIRTPTRQQRMAFARARARGDEQTLERLRMMRQADQRRDRRQLVAMQAWWLRRMIAGDAPAQEKLTLFWHGHFVSGYRGVENSAHLYAQNRLLRAHALGNFADLTRGIIRDPAMLAYLNNETSNRRRPNENLARELMELFTLGEGWYSERDVKEAARALTGYSVEGDDFIFRRTWHDAGTKRILGRRGAFDGDDLVRIILDQPRCAEHVATSVYQWLVRPLAEDPKEWDEASRSVVRAMASDIRRAGYELRPTVRRLLLSEHFYDPVNRWTRIKSPIEVVVGAARALGLRRAPFRSVGGLLRGMGQIPFLPPSVEGWPGGRAWISASTLQARQNVGAALVAGRAGGRGAAALLEGGGSREPEACAAHLMRALLGELGDPDRSPGAAQREEAIASFARSKGRRVSDPVARAMAALALATPEYQVC